jgi:hypothetical protein
MFRIRHFSYFHVFLTGKIRITKTIMMIMQQTIQDKSLRGESPPPSRLVLAPGCREESGLEPEQNTAAPQLPNLLTWLWAQDLLIRVKRAASSRGHE